MPEISGLNFAQQFIRRSLLVVQTKQMRWMKGWHVPACLFTQLRTKLSAFAEPVDGTVQSTALKTRAAASSIGEL